jgi:superfamily I DNA/RNA helicase
MHAGKSLEFALADANDARRFVEERERHLLRLGCTRARDSLPINYSRQPTPVLVPADQHA